ncbi:hypothetical protein Ae201684P_000535 [Aphanomyces euteiches]|nr:hypothetical protein Ae201684P_000535 [Aphanomyces euteiches]
MKKSLERSCIKFVPLSRPVTFHVAIYTTEDEVPTAIWLQRQRSKVEWGCFVRDVANHTPKGAQYVLPSSVVPLESAEEGKQRMPRGFENETEWRSHAGAHNDSI